MNKLNFYFFTGVLVSFLLTSCGGKSSSELNADVARFVSSSDEVVGYGYVNLTAIKGKSELSQVPTIGEFVNNQMESIENSLKLTDKVHYAFEGPFNKDGLPKFAYFFMTVENQDSTLKMFEEMGFFFEEENDLMVSYDMNMALGYNESTVVLVSGNFGDEPKDKLMAAFSSFKNKEKNDDVTEILAQSTDILIAGNLEGLYATSNTSLENLEKKKQSEIKELVKDGHFCMTIDFNNGDLTTKMDFSRVSEKLKEKVFFKDELAGEILAHIGPGEPIIAMATSLDMEKLENMMEDFSPSSGRSFFQSLGPAGDIFGALAEDKLSNLVNGNIGMMMNASQTKELMGFANVPNSHLYLGLGENTENMRDLLETYAEEEKLEDLGEGYYKVNESIMRVNEESIIVHSSDSLKSDFEIESLQEMEGMADFDKYPFSLFVNLKKLSETEITPESGQIEALVDVMDFMTLTADKESIVLKLVLKNKDENILKQLIDVFEEELKNRMGEVSI